MDLESPFSGARVAIVGCGVMGEAVVSGLLAKGHLPAQSIIASHPRAARREELRRLHGLTALPSNAEAARLADVIVLAVKPQAFPAVALELSGSIGAAQLVMSLVTGIRLSTLTDSLQASAIVRVVPNTPSAIGHGFSAWCVTATISSNQLAWARAILSALGEEACLQEEHLLDAATALSGSGPAYFFLVLEAMTDAGAQLGLPRPLAQRMALQTMLGSALYARDCGRPPAALREQVASLGGTTAAALRQLEEGGVRAAFDKALWAAFQRAQELGAAAETANPAPEPNSKAQGA